MRMHEFGEENEKTILFLHGAGSTYKMWTPQIEKLKKEYHIYAVTMSGHESGDDDFISSKEEAKKIVNWFGEHGQENVFLLCGVSLGAHVAAEILQLRYDFAEYAMIESIKAYRYEGRSLKLFSSIGKKVLKKYASVKGYMPGMYKQKYASDDSKQTIGIMSEASLDNIMVEVGHYRMKEMPQRITAKTIILYGGKEKKECRLNSDILAKQILQCKVIVINGFKHGELAVGSPDKHLDYLEKLVSGVII